MKEEMSIRMIDMILVIASTVIFTAICMWITLYTPTSKIIPIETTSPYVLVYTDTYFNCEIVYDKDTKVMYSISNGTYNRGTPTVLLNADGTPKIWEGDE